MSWPGSWPAGGVHSPSTTTHWSIPGGGGPPAISTLMAMPSAAQQAIAKRVNVQLSDPTVDANPVSRTRTPSRDASGSYSARAVKSWRVRSTAPSTGSGSGGNWVPGSSIATPA